MWFIGLVGVQAGRRPRGDACLVHFALPIRTSWDRTLPLIGTIGPPFFPSMGESARTPTPVRVAQRNARTIIR